MNDIRGQNILNFVKELPDDESSKTYLVREKLQGTPYTLSNMSNHGIGPCKE